MPQCIEQVKVMKVSFALPFFMFFFILFHISILEGDSFAF